MVDFTQATASQVQKWSKDVTREYLRASKFDPFMGKMGIIAVKNDLLGSAGNTINCDVFGALRGAPNNGSVPLAGNEVAMKNRSMAVRTRMIRQATKVTLTDTINTEVDLYGEAQAELTDWLAGQLRDDLITQFRAVPVLGSGGVHPQDSVIAFEAADDAHLAAYLTANNDRILFGGTTTNTVAGNFVASLDKITAGNGTLSAATVMLAKRQAKRTTMTGGYAIKPFKTKNGQEWFVMFVDSNGFRDLMNDPDIKTYNQTARPREGDFESNPLYTGGDLVYQGVIIKEIEEYDTIGTGTGNLRLGQAQLCGLQAVNLGYSRKAVPTRAKEDDHGYQIGIGVREYRGESKASIDGQQIGMLTLIHASVND